jgi:HAD superfamily hydrolase (TIGR01490 family)
MNLALFDLDNTLLSGDSDYEWAQFLVEQGVVDPEVYKAGNDRFYRQYMDGTLDIHEFLDFQLAPLARHPREQLERWRESFMDEKIRPIILPRARALIEEHRGAGDLCAIITATNSFITSPIARAFGIPHLVATEPEVVGGRFTGRSSGVPCFREGKPERVREWLREQGLSLEGFPRSSFYSDSRNDIPLLEVVSRPVAVDPDPVLERLAQDRGWQLMSLR